MSCMFVYVFLCGKTDLGFHQIAPNNVKNCYSVYYTVYSFCLKVTREEKSLFIGDHSVSLWFLLYIYFSFVVKGKMNQHGDTLVLFLKVTEKNSNRKISSKIFKIKHSLVQCGDYLWIFILLFSIHISEYTHCVCVSVCMWVWNLHQM